MRLYLDACIWRDYWEDRSDRFRPLGEWAFRLLKAVRADKDVVIASELLIDELGRHYSRETAMEMFAVIPSACLKSITSTPEQDIEAKMLAKERGVAFGDALHAILARDCGALMVTRDHHFERLADIAPVKKPEDLI